MICAAYRTVATLDALAERNQIRSRGKKAIPEAITRGALVLPDNALSPNERGAQRIASDVHAPNYNVDFVRERRAVTERSRAGGGEVATSLSLRMHRGVGAVSDEHTPLKAPGFNFCGIFP